MRTLQHRVRIGRLSVSMDMIDHEPQIVRLLLSQLLVLRAESRYDMGVVEYIASSPHFDEVPFGSLAPEYLASMHSDGPLGFITFRFDRIVSRQSMTIEQLNASLERSVAPEPLKAYP